MQRKQEKIEKKQDDIKIATFKLQKKAIVKTI